MSDSATGPRVLFVSKPIAPPWHDGSKNLVRDVATHLTRAVPTVLTTSDAPSLGPRVKADPIYLESGAFSPGFAANARVMRRLVMGDAQDLWHFVFAPNQGSSTAARVARRTRRIAGWRGPVIQTIASAPSSFEHVKPWIFGDLVVALTEWTRARLLAAGVDGKKLRVIPPCAIAPPEPTLEERRKVRERYKLGHGPVVLYPGDYEVSSGARIVGRAAATILRAVPDARVVFACRAKTPESIPARDELVNAMKVAGYGNRTRHVGEVDDLPALIAESSVVAFPVDDLFGKVDIPLVLLEAMALGVPLILVSGGPLEAVTSARFVSPGDSEALACEVVALLSDDRGARGEADAGRSLYRSRFHPSVVAAAYDALYDEALAARE